MYTDDTDACLTITITIVIIIIIAVRLIDKRIFSRRGGGTKETSITSADPPPPRARLRPSRRVADVKSEISAGSADATRSAFYGVLKNVHACAGPFRRTTRERPRKGSSRARNRKGLPLAACSGARERYRRFLSLLRFDVASVRRCPRYLTTREKKKTKRISPHVPVKRLRLSGTPLGPTRFCSENASRLQSRGDTEFPRTRGFAFYRGAARFDFSPRKVDGFNTD